MNKLQSSHYRNVSTDPLGTVAVPLGGFRKAHSGNHWSIAKAVNQTVGQLTFDPHITSLHTFMPHSWSTI